MTLRHNVDNVLTMHEGDSRGLIRERCRRSAHLNPHSPVIADILQEVIASAFLMVALPTASVKMNKAFFL